MTDQSDILAEIRAWTQRIPPPPPSPYQTPEEPRDTEMAAQLTAQFAATGKVRDAADPMLAADEQAALQLTGLPIEDIARQVNLQWLAGVTELIQTSQETDPSFGTPDDWTLVCSAHLFEHWERVENIEVLRNPVLPPWSVYLVRSAAWWTRQIANEPLRFGPVYEPQREAEIIPFPRFETKEPTDDPQD